jgi:hypothetical protein
VTHTRWPWMLTGVFSLAWICSLGVAATASSDDSQMVAVRLVDHIMARDFDAAAGMFHYPKTQSSTERDADRRSVARWLKTLCTELGHLKTADALRPPPRTGSLLLLSIAGGDVTYWSSRGAVKSVVYSFRASFEREPDTRLSVHALKTDELWEVQSFHFGVSATRPNAKGFVGTLARKLVP